MLKCIIVAVLACPLFASAATLDPDSVFAAKIEHRAIDVHLSADAVRCGLRTAEWGSKTFNAIYAGAIADAAEMFPRDKAGVHVAYARHELEAAINRGGKGRDSDVCDFLARSGTIDALEEQVRKQTGD